MRKLKNRVDREILATIDNTYQIFFLSYDTRGLECDKVHTLTVIVISGAHFIIGSLIMLSTPSVYVINFLKTVWQYSGRRLLW